MKHESINIVIVKQRIFTLHDMGSIRYGLSDFTHDILREREGGTVVISVYYINDKLKRESILTFIFILSFHFFKPSLHIE